MILDLFAGPGGWDEGARIAGYDGFLVGLEHDQDACHTAVAAGHARVRADVAAYPPEVFAAKVTGLIASPPCQSFSRAGNRKGLEDDRGQLVWQPLRWARALRPQWIACEQVPDVLPIWQIIAAALREDGYTVWTGVLNSADYGVAQVRKRAVLVARLGGPVGPPEPTHARNAEPGLFGDVEPWVTMAEALGWGLSAEPAPVVMTARGRQAGDSDVLRGSSWRAAWWETARHDAGRWTLQSSSRRKVNDRTLPKGLDEQAMTVAFGHSDMSWVYERPATTVQCDPRIGRPGHKDRDGGEAQFAEGAVRVSVEEAARLQSFRADYPWRGSKTKQFQQVGNAIPPLLAAAVLRQFVTPASARRAA